MHDHILIMSLPFCLAAWRGFGINEWRSVEAQHKHAGSEVAEASRKGFGILVGFGLTWVVKLSVVRWAAAVLRSAHGRLHAGSVESLDVATLEMCSVVQSSSLCEQSYTCCQL